ncbi:MAG: hypothetical protein EOM50_10535 [Erysipelotrichia bacterium]|nr:hypothetical protein [Erysipelotrichia bacterium]
MEGKNFWILYRAAFKHISLNLNEIDIILALYENVGRENILSVAKKKKILPAIASLMVRLKIEEEYWNKYIVQFRARNQKILACLDSVYSSLYSAGVTRMVVIENFGALLSSGQDLSMFGSGDVDNYADLSQKEIIYDVFKNLGFTIHEIKAGSILISSSFRKEGFLPEKIYFSINWDITCRINLPCLTSTIPIIDWNNLISYKGTAIRLPPIESLMYICMLHVGVHGYSRAPDIRLYYDIANVERSFLDWSLIMDWANKDGNSTRIAIVGYLSKQLLGVNIPEYIVSMGNSAQKRRLLNLVYDQTNNRLKTLPNRLTTLGIDVFSNDNGALEGLRNIIFPDRIWLYQRYGITWKSNFRHIAQLI